MKVFNDITEILLELARATGRHYVLLSWCDVDYWIGIGQTADSYFDELVKAAPILEIQEDWKLKTTLDCIAFIQCKTSSEALEVYNKTVGDDGPTDLNKYNGPMRVYALIIHPEGMGAENT